MKAVIYDKRSSPVLVLREVEKPVPADHEVLVKIQAVSVNASDYRSMNLGIIPKHKIFGSDIAGLVEAVGSGSNMLKVGDSVFGDISSCGFGGFAEYVAVPENALTLIPAGISFEKAAAVPMSAITALQALRDKGQVQVGQKVLICGAGGGVGTFAVQLAKYYGAEVTAVCGTRNVGLVKQLGADHVIDYTQEDFTRGAARFDLILAVNGSYSLSAYRRILARQGVCVMVGGALKQVIKFLLFGPLISLGSKKFRSLPARPNPKDLEFVIRLVEQGKIVPVIDRQYALAETAEAVKYLNAGHASGKVILKP